MRLKYYIRGMGAGIVLTTIILAISGSLKNVGAEGNTTDVTSATTGSVIAYTTAAETQKATDSTTAAQQDATTADQSQTTAAATTAEATTATTSVSQTQGAEKGQSVQVTIKDVYYSTQAADILYNAGVIDDRSAFNAYMQSSGYATKIQEGTYTLTKGASFDEIAKIITKSK